MNFIETLSQKLYCVEIPEPKQDSQEYIKQLDKYRKIYDELSNSLNDEQKRMLFVLDNEKCMLEGQYGKDKFFEGSEKGFKMAVKLLFDCMRD